MKRVLLAGALALVFASTAASASNSLADVASQLAGRPVAVSCARFDSMVAGRAYASERRIELARDVCAALHAAPRIVTPAYPRASSGEAVLTLAHESMHIRGIRNEIKADCLGMRHLRRAALLVGFRPAQLPTLIAQASEVSYCGAGA